MTDNENRRSMTMAARRVAEAKSDARCALSSGQSVTDYAEHRDFLHSLEGIRARHEGWLKSGTDSDWDAADRAELLRLLDASAASGDRSGSPAHFTGGAP